MIRFTTCCLLLTVCGAAHAQDTLRLSNSSDDDMIMKYLPRNQRPARMNEQMIPAGKTVAVTLRGDDPYDVSFHLKEEVGKPNFQAKVGTGNGIPLRQLARTNRVFDVQLTLAAKEVRGRQLQQVMSATLTDNQGSSIPIVTAPGDATEFVEDVLENSWDTTFVAGNGRNTPATVDFDNLTFKTSQFTGRFEDLTVFEGPGDCQIVGRWSALNSRGDVYFTIDKQNPKQLKGEYTFDGKNKRLRWSGNRR